MSFKGTLGLETSEYYDPELNLWKYGPSYPAGQSRYVQCLMAVDEADNEYVSIGGNSPANEGLTSMANIFSYKFSQPASHFSSDVYPGTK
jgi:hypothetical protein